MSIHFSSTLDKVDSKSFSISKAGKKISLNKAAWKEARTPFIKLLDRTFVYAFLRFIMEEPRFLNIDCMFGLLSPHQQYSLLNNLMINLHQDKLSVQFPTEVEQDRILTFSEDRVDFYVCMMVMRGLLKELVHREILINNQKRTVKQDESWICFAQKLCCLEYDDGVKEGEVSYETRKLVAELYNTFLWRQVPIDKSKLSKTLHKNCNFYHWSAMIDYVMSNVLFKHVTPGLVILEHCSFDDKEYHKHQVEWIKNRTEKFEKIYTPKLLPQLMKLIPLLNEDTDAIDCIAKKVNHLPHPIKFRYQEPKCVVCGKNLNSNVLNVLLKNTALVIAKNHIGINTNPFVNNPKK